MEGLDYIVSNFIDNQWRKEMNTNSKIKVGTKFYLQGNFEMHKPLLVKVIGFVYDRTDKTYIYNLVTDEKRFILRTEDYILRNWRRP